MDSFEPLPYDGSDDVWMYSDDESINSSEEFEEFGVESNQSNDVTQEGGNIRIDDTTVNEPFEPMINWEVIENNGEVRHEKFKRTERRVVFKIEHNFKNFSTLKQYEEAIDTAFENAVRPLLNNSNPDDIFSAYIEHEKLHPSVYIGYQKVRAFDKHAFLNKLYAIAQSNTKFLLDGALKVRVAIIRIVVGSGRTKRAINSYDHIKKLKSVIKIRNNNNACGYIAIAVGIKYHEWNVAADLKQRRWKNLREYSPNMEHLGEAFCNEYNLPINEELTLEMLTDRVQPQLEGQYQIIVINYVDGSQLFVGPDCEKVIYLLFNGHESHYDFIKEMKSYLNRPFYCKHCNKAFEHVIHHNCGISCSLCRGLTVCVSEDIVRLCDLCNKTFNSDKCFNQHIKNKCCTEEKLCLSCELKYRFDKKHAHKCGEYLCHQCNEYYEQQPHNCYLKPIDISKLQKDDETPKIIVTFDIESMLIQRDDICDHKPIFLSWSVTCSRCWDNKAMRKNTVICDFCGDSDKDWYGEDCVSVFIQRVISLSKIAAKSKAYIYVIAHNLSGYDGHWIFKELLKLQLRCVTPIMKGTKIMKIDVNNVRFIDSLLFFQKPLSDLPAMFDLEDEEKGFFPHYYNTPENQRAPNRPISTIDKELYGYNRMTAKNANKFDNWYQLQCENNTIFDLKSDMKTYCRQDVKILLKSIMKFRELFIETTKIDPISRSFTLASIGLEYFKAKILEKQSMGITPIYPYTRRRNQSFKAYAWLEIQEKVFGSEMLREYRVGPYTVDGVIDKPFFDGELNKSFNKIAFEFLGCKWHGCSQCKHNDENLSSAVEKRYDYLLKQNIKPVFVWEHEWDREVKSSEFKEYYTERYRFHQKLNKNNLYCLPRKALHGGRVNNIKFSHKIKGNEKIMYYDIVSLYPFVMSRNYYPMGHPIAYQQNFPQIKDVFGFISCKVLPPKQLFFPVLPMTINSKLLFTLCFKCAKEENHSTCECSDDNRCLTGVFCSNELQKALELGYKVIEIYEILHYPQQRNDIFQKYINSWYKIKAEASGFPNGIVSEDQYISDFEKAEGFQLEKEKIHSNPGMRNIAKLMLNSLWSKFAQRANQPVTKVCKNFSEFYEIVNNDKNEILGDQMIEDMLLMNYRLVSDEMANPRNTCVAVASFVTSWARLKLFDEITKIHSSNPGSVLYFDTDSVIFIHKDNKYKPNISNFLGEMSDEIKDQYGVGTYISEFYSTGPKVYAMNVVKPDGSEVKTFKAKGLTQSIEANKTMNFNLIKEKALNTANSIENENTFIPQQQFRCDVKHNVTTRNFEKKFNVTSNKRRIIGNNTLPYGWTD